MEKQPSLGALGSPFMCSPTPTPLAPPTLANVTDLRRW